MKVVVTGAEGQLGRDLVDALSGTHEIYPFDLDLDVTDYQKVMSTIPGIKPDVTIHGAALTDVDGCELDSDRAFLVNAIGTANVALACREAGARMVYVSTDFVFDGKKTDPYTEFDETNPLSVYGKSKLAGENYVASLLHDYYIVRTAWLYGKNGKNFVETILRLAAEQPDLKVVDDQIGSPTYSHDLARKIAEVIETSWYGLYHVTNSGSCSWFEFAKAILEQAGQSKIPVKPIKSDELGRPAPRPRYSVLRNYVLELRGFSPMRDYRAALAHYFS